MAETQTHDAVEVRLDDNELGRLENRESVQVECPRTGETILFAFNERTTECECCGQTIEAITPSTHGLAEGLRDGGTAMYTTIYDDEALTLIVRATRTGLDASGWQ